MVKISNWEWTEEQLQRIVDLLEVVGPIDDRLSRMTSFEIAHLVIEYIWEGSDVTTPQSAVLGEVIERLLLQGEYVRGDEIAEYDF